MHLILYALQSISASSDTQEDLLYATQLVDGSIFIPMLNY